MVPCSSPASRTYSNTVVSSVASYTLLVCFLASCCSSHPAICSLLLFLWVVSFCQWRVCTFTGTSLSHSLFLSMCVCMAVCLQDGFDRYVPLTLSLSFTLSMYVCAWMCVCRMGMEFRTVWETLSSPMMRTLELPALVIWSQWSTLEQTIFSLPLSSTVCSLFSSSCFALFISPLPFSPYFYNELFFPFCLFYAFSHSFFLFNFNFHLCSHSMFLCFLFLCLSLLFCCILLDHPILTLFSSLSTMFYCKSSFSGMW